ncbi:MAG: OmpA family protein [Bacteroidetes bacterium]|nr:OmpA family protein [Bacteroidota bacterium]
MRAKNYSWRYCCKLYLPGEHDINYVVVSTKQLDSKTKKTLDEFVSIMRNNPNFKIVLKTFYSTNLKLSVLKAQIVKKYLVDKNGIDEERFIIAEPKKLENLIDKNRVYFIPPFE